MRDYTEYIRLKDGRRLGFVRYGDLKGKPLFYFHGWPSSRLSAAKYDTIAKKLHICIISPDRPGYGRSDYQDGRTLLDWPDDVITLADYLMIKKFSVLGVSGGGPYAAACAYKISKRITKTGIVVGLSPVYGPQAFDGMMWISRIGWANFGKFSFARRISVLLQYINVRWGPSWGIYGYLFGAKADRKKYDTALRISMRKNYKEAFMQGYRGPELDLKLYSSDWGFDLKKIQSPVYLWYGEADQNVSLNMGKYYHQQISNSIFTVYPGEGHLVSITHADEILNSLTN